MLRWPRNLGPLSKKPRRSKNIKISAQFQTNSRLVYEYLRNATRYHSMVNGVANYDNSHTWVFNSVNVLYKQRKYDHSFVPANGRPSRWALPVPHSATHSSITRAYINLIQKRGRLEAPSKRRRRRGGMGRGWPLPSRLWGLGERHKLPQRGPGRSPGRKRVLVHFELEGTHLHGNNKFCTCEMSERHIMSAIMHFSTLKAAPTAALGVGNNSIVFPLSSTVKAPSL